MKAGLKPFSLGSALAQVRDQLQTITDTPGLDAQVLIAHIYQKDKSWVLAHPEYNLSADQSAQLNHSLDELLKGTPLPYILGYWEFFGHRFRVTPDVLIPRPETELLVETAYHWLKSHPERRWAAETGVGSGCISISLAIAVPDLRISATDISPMALDLAGENAQQYGVEQQISLLEDDLLAHQAGRFDLIIANLPYIPTASLHNLPVYQREPTLALDGGEDGLDLINRLLAQSVDKIEAGGLILLEIESGQGNSAPALAKRYYPQGCVQVKSDLSGLPRLLAVQI
ncbi:MAG: peptide chain release factor N(5)-glutamine methyltransferase [Anaerolineales bacterium]|nr:peptide chain release factor N(5)-glutamine methyltransferase [Anaerolineales bacterium]